MVGLLVIVRCAGLAWERRRTRAYNAMMKSRGLDPEIGERTGRVLLETLSRIAEFKYEMIMRQLIVVMANSAATAASPLVIHRRN